MPRLFVKAPSGTPLSMAVPWRLNQDGQELSDTPEASHHLVELRAFAGSFDDWVARAKSAALAAAQEGHHALVLVTNAEQLCSHYGEPEEYNLPRLRAGDVLPRPGESGWIWDRAWRQVLESLAVARWWLDGDGCIPDRRWLRTRVEVEGERWPYAEAPPTTDQSWHDVRWTSEALVTEFAGQHVPSGTRLQVNTDWTVRLQARQRTDQRPVEYVPTLPRSGLLAAVVAAPHGEPEVLRLQERVLVATLGMSPGVVTETLDFCPVPVDRVVVIHTRTTRDMERLRLDLRPRSPDELAQCLEAADLPAHRRLALASCTLPYADLLTDQDNWTMLERLTALIRHEQSAGNLVQLSVAGGRKTMSALGFLAGLVEGIRDIRHVLVATEKPGTMHVLPSEGHLPPLPALPLDQVIRYVLQQSPELEASWHQGDLHRIWDRLGRETAAFLQESIDRAERLLKEREQGLHSLASRLDNPLLPDTLQIGLLTNRHIGGLPARYHPVSDIDVSDLDAFIVDDDRLKAPKIATVLSHVPVPVIVLSDDSEASPRARYYEQQALTLSWTPIGRIEQLPAILESLLTDDQRHFEEVEIKGDAVEPKAVLRRLFSGEVSRHLRVERMHAGFSGADKYWVHVDDRPRRYLVKVAPLESCLNEYRNYWRHVRGYLDNSAGRIELRPAQHEHQGAIAYTEAGKSRQTVSLGARLRSHPHPELLERVFDLVSSLHSQTAAHAAPEALLNPLLPVREVASFDPQGTPETGLLHELAQEELQFLDANRRRVTVNRIPPVYLRDRRLRIGRTIHVPHTIETDYHTLWRTWTHDLGVTVPDAPELNQFWKGCQPRTGIIHGDLNLENILVEDEALWLIDFANTGPGVILYDYAKVEVELWTHCHRNPPDWAAIRQVIECIYAGRPAGGKAKFASLIHCVQRLALQWGSESDYARVRAAYALNTVKFKKALNPAQRRLGLALALHFLGQ